MSDPSSSSSWSDAAVAGDETAVLAAEARQNLARCEQEIATIKASLRNLGQPSDSEEPNTLTITWIKVRFSCYEISFNVVSYFFC
jgi:hypothetical protein